MKKWYFIIDIAKCMDCNNCIIACKDEHDGNDWPGYTMAQPRHDHRWINIHRLERGEYPLIDVAYRPTPCMHCQDAPCIKASNGAVTRRNDGIVLIDPEKSVGQKELVSACPYRAIYWNEEKNVPQKCTMCAHLLDEGWTQPRCAQACYTGALKVELLTEAEISEKVKNEGLEQLHPEKGTRPSVYYKNLYRFDKVFIAGSAAAENKGVIDCVQDARVKLYHAKNMIQETVTDAFGDFKFDHLAKNSGEYVVQLESEGHNICSLPVDLTLSVNLGTIMI